MSNEIRAVFRQTLLLIPRTEKGDERQGPPSYILLLGNVAVLPIKICAYQQMFTLVDILQLRNTIWFSKYQTLSRRWHFRQQVSHAWKMPQSTDGALKWLHRNRTHVRDRFNFLDVTFMTNADRTEKREWSESGPLYCKCHIWKNVQVKQWTDTNIFRLYLVWSSQRG